MTSTLQRLIDALRDELQQHGEVLGLLDAGQLVLSRKAVPRAARAAAAFASQAESLLQARAHREKLQQQLAWACQRPDASTPPELLPLVSGDIRPLLQALFEENEALHRQIKERARQHHPWLPSSAALTARLLSDITQPAPVPARASTRPANVIVPGALSA